MLRKATMFVVLTVWATACADRAADESSKDERPEDGSSSTQSPWDDDAGDPAKPSDLADGGSAPTNDAGQDSGDPGRGSDASTAPDASVPACPDQGSVNLASPSKLQAWLRTRAYQCWEQESAVHASKGPHSGNVKTYLNDALYGSFEEKAVEHPTGAIAVKELYGKSKTTPFGWAVGIKTQAKSNGGKGWYWYEVFDTSSNTTNYVAGQNHSECTPCHSGGKDFVLSPFPLQ